MNKLLVAALAAVSISVFAQEATKTPESATLAKSPRNYLRAGAAGFVQKRGEGIPMVFLDYREKATDLSAVKEEMQSYTHIAIDIVKENKTKGLCAMKSGLKYKTDGKAAAVVVISDEGDAPMMVVSPEDNVAVINASRLAAELPEGKADEVYSLRLCKEIWRAVGIALAGYGQIAPCVMKPVSNVKDIDALEMRMFCPQINEMVMKCAKKINVARMKMVPYGLAVKQGWAPAPANEAQKAVWDAVKAEEAKAADETEKVKSNTATPAPAAK